jgi:hypothetical protein
VKGGTKREPGTPPKPSIKRAGPRREKSG